MTGVRVMEVAIDQVVDMVAVRHGLVSTAGAMNVPGRVSVAGMTRRASCGVCGVDRDRALVDVIAVSRVEVAIMEIVDMAAVPYRAVPAVGTVDVIVLGVNLVRAHRRILSKLQFNE